MAKTITNQASLSYRYNGQTGGAVSNIATATIGDPLEAQKRALGEEYRPGREITYIVSFENTACAPLSGITVTDDLGSYAVGTRCATPLTFSGPALLYINGEYIEQLSPNFSANSVSFRVGELPVGASALVIYRALPNVLAPLEAGSVITNTVTITAAQLNEPVTVSNTLGVAEYAQVTISKSMSPVSCVCGEEISYTFAVYNHGNTAAADIVLTDAFDPAPAGISVRLNGEVLSPARYTYTAGRLTVPAASAQGLTLPAAEITRDPLTGSVTVTPSMLEITVSGSL